ncbi:MAG TPA: protein-L-isoaspartate(D-aspartate) O-methyltransferase [Thermoanaerobaculia bacterium]|nr:protein-L-isoaspartate(D-aspartate) O-methyltransferase [Thermoanaerobaculia bacterium]
MKSRRAGDDDGGRRTLAVGGRATERERMVSRQIAARGVRDERVLEAMRRVPREPFLRQELRDLAYEDSPLPIAEGQTISQPYMVALMTEALELGPDDRVLEIGTGSGYAAAVLAEVAAEVVTVERHRSLADEARRRLAGLGYDQIEVVHADGTLGWPERAPYDAIVVAAGGPDVPAALQRQLAIGGRLVIPVGPTRLLQTLVRLRRVGEKDFRHEDLGEVRFVPLVGEEGWEDDESTARPGGGRRS